MYISCRTRALNHLYGIYTHPFPETPSGIRPKGGVATSCTHIQDLATSLVLRKRTPILWPTSICKAATRVERVARTTNETPSMESMQILFPQLLEAPG